MTFFRLLSVLLTLALLTPVPAVEAQSNQGPLRIRITEGVIEPLPFAIPEFIAESPAAAQLARQVSQVIAADLTGTGLFREIPASAHISEVTNFNAPVQFADWKAINAQALITGSVGVGSGGQMTVKFRLFDVFSEAPLGEGLQFGGTQDTWRRMAHKVADQVYSRITGESGYFDSRVVFVSESGDKANRAKRLAIMDYDGANVQFLTGNNALVLAPRISTAGDRVLYTSYETGRPTVFELNVANVSPRALNLSSDAVTFSPRYAPDGRSLIYSQSQGGNTDLYRFDVNTGQRTRLTSSPAIDTAPSYSPDGRQIVFESDRSGSQQLYIMPATGGEARRISFGQGRYGTPVWSPRGDLIAFTKQNQGRFHIGVIRVDGSGERLLTASFLDEGPTWSPNGRVIMFTRETQGASGAPALFSVDVSGRNLKRVPTPGPASDPAWSPLLQ
ncbi:MAG: Tol-Pal system protein TolB [Rhodobacteraceae bacterium]|nr:Tol-Pal system protein TolB [Paracoccaceae bacterium]